MIEVFDHPVDFGRIMNTSPALALHLVECCVGVIEPTLIEPKGIPLSVHDPRKLWNGFRKSVKLFFAFKNFGFNFVAQRDVHECADHAGNDVVDRPIRVDPHFE